MRKFINKLALFVHNYHKKAAEEFLTTMWLNLCICLAIFSPITFWQCMLLYIVGGSIMLGIVELLRRWGSTIEKSRDKLKRTFLKLL